MLEISTREEFGNVDSWIEYLYIHKVQNQLFKVSIKVHIIIDSIYEGHIIDQFYNHEKEEYDFPKIVNDHVVFSWDGDFLKSTKLHDSAYHEALILNKNNYENELQNWLKQKKWDLNKGEIQKIQTYIQQH